MRVCLSLGIALMGVSFLSFSTKATTFVTPKTPEQEEALLLQSLQDAPLYCAVRLSTQTAERVEIQPGLFYDRFHAQVIDCFKGEIKESKIQLLQLSVKQGEASHIRRVPGKEFLQPGSVVLTRLNPHKDLMYFVKDWRFQKIEDGPQGYRLSESTPPPSHSHTKALKRTDAPRELEAYGRYIRDLLSRGQK